MVRQESVAGRREETDLLELGPQSPPARLTAREAPSG
jgi:hypothetical protein